MPQPTVSRILVLLSFALASANLAVAQSTTTTQPIVIHGRNSSWQVAQVGATSMHKFIVVTVDEPDRRQTCRVQSFTQEKLVCSRAVGGPRTYLPQQIVALIVPGDGGLRIPIWIGLNAGLGASIWGTVVLAAACPACAAATGIAAFIFFAAAGAIAYGDDVPDKLLYIAPGQKLSNKFHHVEDWP